MKLVCYIGDKKFDVVQGATISEEFNETLDSASIIIRTEEELSDEFMKPYRDVILLDEDVITNWNGYTKGQKFQGFFKHFLIDKYHKEDLTLREEDFKYKIDLFSETKGLETVQLPNSSLTQPLNLGKKRSVWECLQEIVEMYSPKRKTAKKGADGSYSDVGEWEYVNKYILDPKMEQLFNNVYAPDVSLNAPNLKDLIAKLMIVKDVIPVVYNDMITCMDISTTHGNFLKTGVSAIISSRSSNDYVDCLRTNYSNALSQEYTCKRTEKLGFRNNNNALMTLENMQLETGYPIYKINKIYMCYYKQGTLMCTNKGKWFSDDRKAVFLCKQDITKLVKLNQERSVLSQRWDTLVDNSPQTIEELAKYKLCTVGYSQGSKTITGWGEKTTYPGGFLYTKQTTTTPIQLITDFMDSKYSYGIYNIDYVVTQRLKEWGLTDEQIAEGGFFYLKFDDTFAQNGLFYDPTNNNKEISDIGVRMKMLFFEVEYEAYYNGSVIHGKDDGDDIVTINDNPSSSLTLLESHGVFQKEKIDRYGNPYLVTTARYESIDDLQPLGSVTEDGGIVYSREFSIYQTCVEATYRSTKHYILKNYFNSVWAKHRTYNLMPYEESISRAENRKSILYLSKDKSYWEDTSLSQLPFSEDFETEKYQSLVSFARPNEVISYGDFYLPNLINFGYLTFDVNKDPQGFGNNYIMNTDTYDTSVGTLYLRYEDENKYIIATNSSGNKSFVVANYSLDMTISDDFLNKYDRDTMVGSHKNDEFILFGLPKTEYNDYLKLSQIKHETGKDDVVEKTYIAQCGEYISFYGSDVMADTDSVTYTYKLELHLSSGTETRYIEYLPFVPQITDLTQLGGKWISYDAENNLLKLELKYMSDINCFVSGNSMCFNIVMNDNVTMGNYIEDLEPNPDVSFFHEADIEIIDEENRIGALQNYELIVDDIQTGYSENIGFYVCHKEDKREVSFVASNLEKQAKVSNIYETLFATPKIVDAYYDKIGGSTETMKIGKKYKINKDNKERIDMTFQIETQQDTKSVMVSSWCAKLGDLIQGNYRKLESDTQFLSQANVANIYYSSVREGFTGIAQPASVPIVIMEITKELYDYEMYGFSLDLTKLLIVGKRAIFFDYESNANGNVSSYRFVPDTANFEKNRIVLVGNQYVTVAGTDEETTPAIMILEMTEDMLTNDDSQGILLPNTARNYYFSNVKLKTISDTERYMFVNDGVESLTYNNIDYGGFYNIRPGQTTERPVLKHGTTSVEELTSFPLSGTSTDDYKFIAPFVQSQTVYPLSETNFYLNDELKQLKYTDNYIYQYPKTMYLVSGNTAMKEELIYNEYGLETMPSNLSVLETSVENVIGLDSDDKGNYIYIDISNFSSKILRQTNYAIQEKKVYEVHGKLSQGTTVIDPIDGYVLMTNADRIELDGNTYVAYYSKIPSDGIHIYYTNVVTIQYWYRYIPNFNELSWAMRKYGLFSGGSYVSKETKNAIANASMKFVFGTNIGISDLISAYGKTGTTPTNGKIKVYYSIISNRDFRIFDDKGNVIGEELNLLESSDDISYGNGQYYKKI